MSLCPVKKTRQTVHKLCAAASLETGIVLSISWPKGSLVDWECELERIKSGEPATGEICHGCGRILVSWRMWWGLDGENVLCSQRCADIVRPPKPQPKKPKCAMCDLFGNPKCERHTLSLPKVVLKYPLSEIESQFRNVDMSVFSPEIFESLGTARALFEAFAGCRYLPSNVYPEDVIAAGCTLLSGQMNWAGEPENISNSHMAALIGANYNHPIVTQMQYFMKNCQVLYHTRCIAEWEGNKFRTLNRSCYAPLNATDHEIGIHMLHDLQNTQVIHLPGSTHVAINLRSLQLISSVRPFRRNFRDIRMTGVFASEFLHKFNNDEFYLRQGLCVPDYIQLMFSKHDYLAAQMTTPRIISELEAVTGRDISTGVSTDEIVTWINEKGYEITVYAVDPIDIKVFKHKSVEAKRHRFALVFVVAGKHLYPITIPEIQNAIFQSGHAGKQWGCALRTQVTIDTEKHEFCSVFEIDRMVSGDFETDCIFTDADLDELVYKLSVDHPDVVVDQLCVWESKITRMIHPITKKIFIHHEDYTLVKALCEKLYMQKRSEDFVFRGQGLTQMAKNIFAIFHGRIKATVNSPKIQEFEDNFSTFSCVQKFGDASEFSCIDHNRCYSTVLRDYDYPWLVFTCGDDIQPYDGKLNQWCMYYVEAFEDTKIGLKLTSQMMSYEMVSFLTNFKMLPHSKIVFQRKARYFLKADIFQAFVAQCEDLEKTLGYARLAKTLVNRLIGTWNQKFSLKQFGYCTPDKQEACALVCDGAAKGDDVTFHDFGNGSIYFVKRTEKEPLKERHSALWTQVVCSATTRVLKRALDIRAMGGRLLGIKTDAIYFTGVQISDVIADSRVWKEEKNSEIPLRTWNPTRDKISETWKMKEWKHLDDQQFIRHTEGALLTGVGGSGKTHTVLEFIKQKRREDNNVNFLVCTVMYASLDVLRKRLTARRMYVTNDKRKIVPLHLQDPTQEYRSPIKYPAIKQGKIDMRTIHSLIATYEHYKKSGKTDDFRTAMTYDYLMIDEFSVLDLEMFLKLWEIKQLVGFKIILSGDPNQCPPVIKNELYYEMHKTELCHSLVDGFWIHKKYNPRFGRYDSELFEFQKELLETRRIPKTFENRRELPVTEVVQNIVKTNRKKIRIWNQTGGKNFKVGDMIYADFNTMTHKDFPLFGLYHCSQYKITNVVPKETLISAYGRKITPGLIAKLDDLNYFVIANKRTVRIPVDCMAPLSAVTAYKVQGNKIIGDFNILEVGNMKFEEFYVAVTRGTKLEHVRFKYNSRKFPSVYDNVQCIEELAQVKPFIAWEISIRGRVVDIYVALATETPTDIKNQIVNHKISINPPADETHHLKLAHRASKAQNDTHSIKSLKRFYQISYNSLSLKNLGIWYGVTASSIEKVYFREKGTPWDFVTAQMNNIDASFLLDDRFSWTKNSNGFCIRKKLQNGDTINVRRRKERDIIQATETLKNEYYPALVYNEKKSMAHDVTILHGQKKSSDFMPDFEEPVLDPTQLPGNPLTFPLMIQQTGDQQLRFNKVPTWYFKEHNAIFEAWKDNKIVVKWIENTKRSNKQRHWFTGSFNVRELIEQLDHLKTAPNYLQEVLYKNVRLYCDVDLDRSEGDFDEEIPGDLGRQEYILWSVLHAMKEVFETHGQHFDSFEKLRILDACTPKKISYHISYIGEIFEYNTDQATFWNEVSALSKEKWPHLWYTDPKKGTERCCIDLSVYSSKRAFRSIYAEKIGKLNRLRPIAWNFETNHFEEIVLPKGEIESFLISTDDNKPYCSWIKKPKSPKKRGRSGRQKYFKKRKMTTTLSLDDEKEITLLDLPEGFEMKFIEKQGDGSFLMYRQGPGFCPVHNRVHDRQQMYLSKNNDRWFVTCCHGGGRVEISPIDDC